MKKYLFLITAFLTVLVASGATYYVVPNGAGNKNGTSWANAYADVQTAIDSAYNAGGGEVWIAKGTYKHGTAMTMKNNVAIYGGFAGTETSKEQRVSGNATILDGEGKYRVFYNDYSSSKPLTNSAKLDNVTIQNALGSGMYNYSASPEITNCTFSDNYGGGMANYDSSSPTLTNCTFSDNYGGGMANIDSSSPTLTNCTFSGNSVYYGGGMMNKDSSPTLTNCTFSGNSAAYGGGMANEYSSSPTLTNCTFTNNTSTGTSPDYGYGGGGMYNGDSSSPTLTNCTFSGNSASGDYYDYAYGGGMMNKDSSPTLTNCTFTSNSAADNGGGMANCDSSSPKLTNCTFASNSAEDYGGGMYNSSSSPTLTNCILWGNTASSSGNEIYNYDSSCTPTIDTCIIKGGVDEIYGNEYGTYTNIIETDPKLQTLADNGGNVQTIALTKGSSAIGAGKVVKGITTDARGVLRSTTLPTIGAYEYEIDDLPVISTQPEPLDIFTNNDGSLSVSATGEALRFQWYFNGEVIEGATEATLSFENIQADKTGSYYCVITNPAGKVQTNTINVVVKQAPSISTQPEALDIFANNDGSLSVSASGEELTYQWYFNGEEIEGATSSTLSFENIQTGKAGSYYCVISNPAGNVQTNTVVS